MLTDDAKYENVPPPLDSTRILKSYYKRNDRRKFSEKKEQSIPREINHVVWLVKNRKTLFSKLMRKIRSLVSGNQVSKQVDYRFPFLDFQIFSRFSSLGDCYSSGTFCTYHLGQIFIKFLTSSFGFYWSLCVQFSCITVRLSDDMFLFSVASDYFQLKINLCTISK